MDNYGDRLRAARKIRGLTQVQLAERLGITQKSYQRMETGVHDLKMSTIYDLCKALEISSDWLIGLNIDTQNPVSWLTVHTQNFDDNLYKVAEKIKE